MHVKLGLDIWAHAYNGIFRKNILIFKRRRNTLTVQLHKRWKMTAPLMKYVKIKSFIKDLH